MAVTERTPLSLNTVNVYDSDDSFQRCVTALCEREALIDNYMGRRNFLKVSAALISAGAKVPFIPISMRLGPVLGPISIYGNGFGFFVLEYWAASHLINDFYSPKTEAQIELEQRGGTRQRNLCRNVVIISAATLFALSSQLTSALPGIKYNEDQYKVVAGIVLLVAGALTPLRSLQLSFNQLSLRCQASAETKITEIKEKMAGLLQANHGLFIQKNHAKKIKFIQECEAERTSTVSTAELANNFVNKLLTDDDQPLSFVQKAVGKTFNYLGLAAGSLLAGIFEYVSGDYTYHSTKTELLDNDVLAGTLATLAVASTAYLFATSIVSTTQRIFNTIGNAVSRRDSRNLGWQLRPKISFALTSIGLLTDLFAVAPTFIIIGDFYNNNGSREFLRDTTCASLFLLLFTSTLDIINDVVTYSITKGSEEEQSILKLSSDFLRLADTIQKCPSREFISYLTNMDEPAKATLLKRIDVTADQLNS